jgi:hypothetical protein
VDFERRNLRPYAEPVSASELCNETVYFAVNFVDDEMLIPVFETVVFIGRDLEAGDVGKVYFQDVQSYREGIRYGQNSEDEWAKFQTGSEDQLGHIFVFERALDVLIRCSARRNEAGV